VLKLRDHGSVRKYYHELVGYNSRLDSVQAAVLNVKLPKLHGWNARRRERAEQYHQLLQGVPGITLPPRDGEGYGSVHHLFVIRVAEGRRESLRQYLTGQQIGTGIHYPVPAHLAPAFAHLNCPRGSFPLAEAYADEVLSLPMMPELTSEQVRYVAEAVRRFAEGVFI
jgi:dTDP-4-amino-4,6-dideoxygalactose transaminase